MSILTAVGDLIKYWFNTFGYGGIVLAMALESCLVPLPSEIVMPVAGAFVVGAAGATVHFSLIGVALAGAVGCVIGSIAAYAIGATGGRPFIMRYGKYLLISRHDFDLADRAFNNYGSGITFFSRLLPVVRTYISLPAGITRMNFGRFVLFTFLGSFPWTLGLAYAGEQLGPQYAKLATYFHGADYVIIGLFVVGVAYYIYRHVKHERAYDARLKAAGPPNGSGPTAPRGTPPLPPPGTPLPPRDGRTPAGPPRPSSFQVRPEQRHDRRLHNPNGPDAPTTLTSPPRPGYQARPDQPRGWAPTPDPDGPDAPTHKNPRVR